MKRSYPFLKMFLSSEQWDEYSLNPCIILYSSSCTTKKAFDVKNMYFNYKTSTKKKTKKITCRSIMGFKKMLKSICILLSKQPWGVVKIILFILYFSGQTLVLSLFIRVYVYTCVRVCCFSFDSCLTHSLILLCSRDTGQFQWAQDSDMNVRHCSMLKGRNS